MCYVKLFLEDYSIFTTCSITYTCHRIHRIPIWNHNSLLTHNSLDKSHATYNSPSRRTSISCRNLTGGLWIWTGRLTIELRLFLCILQSWQFTHWLISHGKLKWELGLTASLDKTRHALTCFFLLKNVYLCCSIITCK